MNEGSGINLVISGVGTASGGTYQNVEIKGVGTVNGDIRCVVGRVEGLATIVGSVAAENLSIQGKATIRGDVMGGAVTFEGQVTVSGRCSADRFSGMGGVRIAGLLNADEVNLRLVGPTYIEEIGASVIRVVKEPVPTIFGRFKMLSATVIEGDDVYLENTQANVVRGNDVVLGVGCKIASVEYRTVFKAHETATVGQHSKV